jgi:AraC family transcriptional regulator
MPGERIHVMRGSGVEPVTAGPPHLTSNRSPLTGFLLEEHKLPVGDFKGVFAGHLIVVNTGEPYWKTWSTEGKRGRLFMAPGAAALCSGQYVSCSWDRPVRFTGVSIEPAVMQNALYEDVNRPVELRPEPGVADAILDRFVRAIDRDVRAGCPGGPLWGESLATDLTAFLLRQYAVHSIKRRCFKGGIPRTRLKRVVDYIEASLAANLRIAELAGVAGMSPYHFGKLFNQSTGMTVHQYVIRRRVQLAMDLLAVSRFSVAEIARAVGIPNQSQFTRLFHQRSGVTPLRFRESIIGMA